MPSTEPLLSVFVHGLPKPQPRFGKGHAYDPKTAKEWKDCIALAVNAEWKGKPPADEPCALGIRFYFPSKALDKGKTWHDKRPDLENCTKAVMDALTDCKVWRDDCIVAALDVQKAFAPDGKIGALILIWKL